MKTKEERVKWFREARYGMFVHWGVYSLLGKAEWVMHNDDIPRDEYRKIASTFNPVKFDADQWVQVMQDSGMKYLVITAKHHDGFAMFKSHCSDYNIVDATSFDRDPMAELAEACHKRDIKLCFYYSHVQDWYEHRVGWDYPQLGRAGKDWHTISKDDAATFAEYYERKCKPQIRELLTQYGPIGLLWFDTPNHFSKEQALDLSSFIRGFQPDCLINGRILDKQMNPERIPDIDYEGMGDNEVPPLPSGIDWEAPVTSCNGWGYRDPKTTEWKDRDLLLKYLIRMAASGGNYLLNIGPTPEGELPVPGVERFRSMGDWLKVNGDSIYGTSGNPFGHDFEWGTVTCKPGKIYLHITGNPSGSIVLNGLESKVLSARFLSDSTKSPLVVTASYDDALKSNRLTIEIPNSLPDPVDSVILLEIEGEVQVEQPTSQLADGLISLPGALATIHKADPDSTTCLAANGIIGGWFKANDWVEWEFKVIIPGDYIVAMVQRADFWGKNKWDLGHKLTIDVADTSLQFLTGEEGAIEGEGAHITRTTDCGTVTFNKTGVYNLKVKPSYINGEHRWGLRLQSLELRPVE